MITVRVVARNASGDPEVVTMSVEAAVPRAGEIVVLDRGRRFRVEGVEWHFASGAGGDHTAVELWAQSICTDCVRPVWPDEPENYPTCWRCREGA